MQLIKKDLDSNLQEQQKAWMAISELKSIEMQWSSRTSVFRDCEKKYFIAKKRLEIAKNNASTADLAEAQGRFFAAERAFDEACLGIAAAEIEIKQAKDMYYKVCDTHRKQVKAAYLKYREDNLLQRLYDMALYKQTVIEDMKILRVPNGWVHASTTSGEDAVYVPQCKHLRMNNLDIVIDGKDVFHCRSCGCFILEGLPNTHSNPETAPISQEVADKWAVGGHCTNTLG